MSSSYLDLSREVVGNIDSVEIASLPLGTHISEGGLFVFQDLAELSLGLFGKEYVGLKMARVENAGVDGRFFGELAVTALLADSSPELRDMLPRFLAFIRTEDGSSHAILTEDASHGGSVPVMPKRLNPKTKQLIYAPFSDYGDMPSVLDEETIDIKMAFRVGETERLLDLAPSPIKSEAIDGTEIGQRYIDEAFEAESALTITLPSGSVLAEAISARVLKEHI